MDCPEEYSYRKIFECDFGKLMNNRVTFPVIKRRSTISLVFDVIILRVPENAVTSNIGTGATPEDVCKNGPASNRMNFATRAGCRGENIFSFGADTREDLRRLAGPDLNQIIARIRLDELNRFLMFRHDTFESALIHLLGTMNEKIYALGQLLSVCRKVSTRHPLKAYDSGAYLVQTFDIRLNPADVVPDSAPAFSANGAERYFDAQRLLSDCVLTQRTSLAYLPPSSACVTLHDRAPRYSLLEFAEEFKAWCCSPENNQSLAPAVQRIVHGPVRFCHCLYYDETYKTIIPLAIHPNVTQLFSL
jgi:hypothetical protein